MGLFHGVAEAPLDAIFGIEAAFRADARHNKVSLAIGVYKEHGKSYLFDAVTRAEEQLMSKPQPKDYLFIDGDPRFLEMARQLVVGDRRSGVYACQTVGGTGGLRLAGDFLVQMGWKQIYMPQPTWANHCQIFARVGLHQLSYPYYNIERRQMLWDQALETLGQAENAVVLFHASCHNPTGCDPNVQQWEALAQLCQRRRLFPIFDLAYQGFGDGMEQDAEALRIFAQHHVEFGVATSFAKNMGLYGERVGALFFVLQSDEVAQRMGSQVRHLVRTNYSNPPRHGAQVARTILETPTLKQEWLQDLERIRRRMVGLRQGLASAMGPDYEWIAHQKGMFSVLGLSDAAIAELRGRHALYVGPKGRINIAALTEERLSEIASQLVGAAQSAH
jgi:aspartate aminotransferase